MERPDRNIAMIGCGYVGLTVGVCLAETGARVTCVDQDQSKISRLSAGQSPLPEPGLEELLSRNLKEGRLRFTTETAGAVAAHDIVMIAVGAPASEPERGRAQVLELAEVIGKNLRKNAVIALKSTIPPGTTRQLEAAIATFTRFPFAVVFNPEFLREGSAVADVMHPTRIVIGGEAREALERMSGLYQPFTAAGVPVITANLAEAEMIKLAANAMLALRVSFMNEIAALCEKTGADVEVVKRGISLDPRIGPHFLNPGIGFGGSCLPKELKSLIHFAQTEREDVPVIVSAYKTNEQACGRFVAKVRVHFKRHLAGRILAVWGLAFKPGTRDVRESPALRVIRELRRSGARIRVFDPLCNDEARPLLDDGVAICQNPLEAADGAEALLILTEWELFNQVDWREVKLRLAAPVVFDGRNLLSVEVMGRLGFQYYAVGRKRFQGGGPG